MFMTGTVKTDPRPLDLVKEELQDKLKKKFYSKDLKTNEKGLEIKGNLNSFWESVAVVGTISLMWEGQGNLRYMVEGDTKPRAWLWICIALGFLTGIGFLAAGWEIIEFFLCRGKVPEYIEDSIKSLQFPT